MEVIADFPSLPVDLVQPLLFVAIDDRARLREPAQKLLADALGIYDQLIAILSDKRQAVRANAARFLADRGAKSVLPALTKRLKTEKSELPPADLISADGRLVALDLPKLEPEERYYVLVPERRKPSSAVDAFTRWFSEGAFRSK